MHVTAGSVPAYHLVSAGGASPRTCALHDCVSPPTREIITRELAVLARTECGLLAQMNGRVITGDEKVTAAPRTDAAGGHMWK